MRARKSDRGKRDEQSNVRLKHCRMHKRRNIHPVRWIREDDGLVYRMPNIRVCFTVTDAMSTFNWEPEIRLKRKVLKDDKVKPTVTPIWNLKLVSFYCNDRIQLTQNRRNNLQLIEDAESIYNSVIVSSDSETLNPKCRNFLDKSAVA